MHDKIYRKIAILGSGSIGKKHFTILNQDKKNIVRVFRRISNYSYPLAAIKGFKPDIVCLCNPASFHSSVLHSILPLDSYFFIEKPIGINENELNKLPKKIKKKIFVGYNLKFSSSLNYFKEYFMKNQLGKILHCEVSVGSDLRFWRKKNYKNSVSASKKLGGGVIYELSHEVDYLKWIFGNITLVFSSTQKISNLEINTEDFNHSFFISKNKLKFIDKIPISLTIDFIRANPERYINVYCEKGTLVWDGIKNKVYLINATNKIILLYKSKLNINHSYMNEWKYFFNIYDKKSKFLINNFNEAMETLKICNLMKKHV